MLLLVAQRWREDGLGGPRWKSVLLQCDKVLADGGGGGVGIDRGQGLTATMALLDQ